MARLQDIEVPDFKEPRLGSHTIGGHTVTMGKGTVGLGKRYATPLEQVCRDEEMSRYLTSLERRRVEAKRVKLSRQRDVTMQQDAAEQRREARLHNERKKALEFQRMDEMRMRVREETLEEERQRKRELDARNKYLHETKVILKAHSEAAKEEQRREFEHQRLERLEAQAAERKEHHEQRRQSHIRLQGKVKRIRLDALQSRQHAVEAVEDLKAKQRQESKRGRDERDRKLEARNNELLHRLEDDYDFAARQRNDHKQKMSRNQNSRLDWVYKAREESKKEYTTQGEIRKAKDEHDARVLAHCNQSRSHRRARSAMEKMYNTLDDDGKNTTIMK